MIIRPDYIEAIKLFACFLVIERVRGFFSSAFTSVIQVNGFLSENFGNFFQSGLFLTTEKECCIAVAHDCIRIILPLRSIHIQALYRQFHQAVPC